MSNVRRSYQPMGAGPGSRAAGGVSRGDDIPNRPRANQPMGVSPGSRAACGVRRGSRVQITGANARRLMGLGRFDIDRQGYDLSNQPRANQPVGVSPGSHTPSGVSRGSRVQKTGANARRLIGLGRFDIDRQGYDLSNQPRANQPVGVSPGSHTPSGASRGSRGLKTGANAHRLMGAGRFDIARQGCDLSNNRYKEVVHEEVDHRPPQAILDELESIEKEIAQGMKQMRGMLK
ncbi:hypothetical protein [Rosistilla oblonga]|uniref:hypothetical protein n=1 Tax=Rosistilla oblonga TaxID=2527990 RepID=UPI003A97DB9C